MVVGGGGRQKGTYGLLGHRRAKFLSALLCWPRLVPTCNNAIAQHSFGGGGGCEREVLSRLWYKGGERKPPPPPVFGVTGGRPAA